jgi:hypothetical protein
MPTIEILQQTHPDFDREHLLDLVALYRGGKCFANRVTRFLPQNEFEPETVYRKRLGAAKYFNYLGPIIDRFSASLIQVPPSLSKNNDEPVDEFWKTWQANVDGLGTDLSELARETITDALMKGRTFLAIEKPVGNAETLAEWKERGLGEIRVKELETQCVIDWGCSDVTGELEWLVYHEIEQPRISPLEKRSIVVETWTVYGKTSTDIYQIRYKSGERPGVETEAPLIESIPNEIGRVPVVVFDVGEGMWLAERASDAQIELFTQRSALNWALKASCYAMPVFHQEEPDSAPVFGVGRGIKLGLNDKVDWFAPPAAPFEVLANSIENCREELYRIVHQMADGISSSASNSARSAKSKSADMVATRAILEAYAVVLRDAIGRIVDLIGAMRGEDAADFTVAGIDKFTDVNISDLFDSIESANRIGMPSELVQLKMRELILDTLMPQLSESARGEALEQLKEGLADLKEKDELEAQYQQALAHALHNDSAGAGKRPGNKTPNAGSNSGGPVPDAKKKKEDPS